MPRLFASTTLLLLLAVSVGCRGLAAYDAARADGPLDLGDAGSRDLIVHDSARADAADATPPDATGDSQAFASPTLVPGTPTKIFSGTQASVRARAIAVDKAENIYVAFSIANNVINLYDPSKQTAQRTLLVSYDATGTIRWTAALTQTDGPVEPVALAVDDDKGTVYLLASVSGTGGLYDSTGGQAVLIALPPQQHALLVALALDGKRKWHAPLSTTTGQSPYVEPRALAVVGGNVYVTGRFSGLLSFSGPPANTFNAAFLARYDENGAEQDAAVCGNSNTTSGTALHAADGRLWLALRYGSNPTCKGVDLPLAPLDGGVALVEIDPATQKWPSVSTHLVNGEISAMAGDAARLYVTGTYVDSGTLWSFSLPSTAGVAGGFVAELDVSQAGVVTRRWVDPLVGTKHTRPQAVVVSSAGVPIVGGYSLGSVSVGGFNVSAGDDGMIFGLDSFGGARWGVRVQGSDQQIVYGMAVTKSGLLYAVGSYETATSGLIVGTHDFVPQPGVLQGPASAFLLAFTLP